MSLVQQELSYRKHIARQLRTQYVDGINSQPVTLKSRLKGYSRSLKLVPFENSGAVSYSPSIVGLTMTLSCVVARYSDLLVENRKFFLYNTCT